MGFVDRFRKKLPVGPSKCFCCGCVAMRSSACCELLERKAVNYTLYSSSNTGGSFDASSSHSRTVTLDVSSVYHASVNGHSSAFGAWDMIRIKVGTNAK